MVSLFSLTQLNLLLFLSNIAVLIVSSYFIHWKENNSVKLINSQSVDSQLISSNPILSKPAQFSSSSLVTSPTRELKNSQSFYSHLSKVPPNHSIDSEGISSLTLNSESSGKSGGEAQRQANTNQKSAHKTKNKVSKNETPLLSFEITKHLYSWFHISENSVQNWYIQNIQKMSLKNMKWLENQTKQR